MLIDTILISGLTYVVYAIVKSMINNGTEWATYQPKHRKRLLPKRGTVAR